MVALPIAMPYFVSVLAEYVNGKWMEEETPTIVYVSPFILVMFSWLISVLINNMCVILYTVAIKMKVACYCLVYNKVT